MEENNTNIQDSLIYVQVLNWLLNNNSIAPILEHDMDDTYFPGYEKEFNYIINYFNESKLKDGEGVVPDKVQFAYDFPDIPLFETNTAINTMCENLLEKKCYGLCVQMLQECASLCKEDSINAIDFVRQKSSELWKLASNTVGSGTDIIRKAGERLEDYIKRIEAHGLLGIPCGLDSLTRDLYGWLPEDYIGVIARTNQGKSWLLLFFAIQAWLNGRKVAIFSGEMSDLMYGFRFDTMYKHFRNSSLIGGDPDLGASEIKEVGPKSINEYRAYIDELINGDSPTFKVFTKKDIGGSLTVDKMRVLQDKFNFDFWGIDQLSFMDDVKHESIERIRYANISEGLAEFTEEYQKPVMVLHQANKTSVKKKKDNDDAVSTPELEDSFGSDAVTHPMTRLLSFTQIEDGVLIKNLKNRYGKKGMEWTAIWNIDYGILKDLDTQDIKDNLF